MSYLLDSLLSPAALQDCILHDPEALPVVKELDMQAWLDALLAQAVADLVH